MSKDGCECRCHGHRIIGPGARLPPTYECCPGCEPDAYDACATCGFERYAHARGDFVALKKTEEKACRGQFVEGKEGEAG